MTLQCKWYTFQTVHNCYGEALIAMFEYPAQHRIAVDESQGY